MWEDELQENDEDEVYYVSRYEKEGEEEKYCNYVIDEESDEELQAVDSSKADNDEITNRNDIGSSFNLKSDSVDRNDQDVVALKTRLDFLMESLDTFQMDCSKNFSDFTFRRGAKEQNIPTETVDDSEGKDPLYDDKLDDEDSEWVARNLHEHVHQSDATLSCPCCFMTVCIDCQRHIKYKNQYRALTSLNCRIKKDQPLRYQPQLDRRHNMNKSECYYPVNCSDCDTQVGVFDEDDIYHFFSVIPSHS